MYPPDNHSNPNIEIETELFSIFLDRTVEAFFIYQHQCLRVKNIRPHPLRPKVPSKLLHSSVPEGLNCLNHLWRFHRFCETLGFTLSNLMIFIDLPSESCCSAARTDSHEAVPLPFQPSRCIWPFCSFSTSSNHPAVRHPFSFQDPSIGTVEREALRLGSPGFVPR